MPINTLPHKKEGYIKKPIYMMPPEDREKRIKELFNVESKTTVEDRRKALQELRR